MEDAIAVEGEDTGHPQRWLVLVIVLLGQFMIVGAVGTVNVALPSIRDDLGASPAAMQWVLVLYQIGYAIVLVTGGRLGDLFGQKRVFIVGLAGFVGSSALAAVAPNVGLLVAARLVQGIFGGITSPQVLAVIQIAFPARERPRAFAVFGTVAGSAFMIGQLMSGGLIHLDPFGLSWRSPFLVNVIIGAAAVVTSIAVLPDTGARHRRRIDVPGITLVSLGGVLLLYPLIQGRSAGWPPAFFVMLAAVVPVALVFLRLERRLSESGGEPLLDTRLFRARSFRAGLIVAIAFSFSTFPIFYSLTLTLQLGYGFDALRAALATAPTPLAVIVMSMLSARLLPRYGRRVMAMSAGGGLAAAAAVVVTLEVAPDALSPAHMIPAMLVLGCGNGLGFTALVNLTLADVNDTNAGSASGLFQTVQQATTAVGVAVAGIVYFGIADATASGPASYVDAMEATLGIAVLSCLSVLVLHRLLPPLPKDAEPEVNLLTV